MSNIEHKDAIEQIICWAERNHDSDCPAFYEPKADCGCGLSKDLEAARAAVKAIFPETST